MNVNELIDQAKSLSPLERIELVDSVLGSLTESDEQWEAAWRIEAQRRAAAIDAGAEPLSDWSDAKAKLL